MTGFDRGVRPIFRGALSWAIFLAVSITAIFASTALLLIRSRVKLQKAQQDAIASELRQAREIASALRVHAARGRTLFLSIHQISDAARFCDRFILLSGGRVRGEGTVPELAALAQRQDEDLEEVFLALT